MNTDYKTKCFPAEKNRSESLPSAEKIPENEKKAPQPYVFYCIVTLSVMFFTLAFAASELFSLFF